MEIHVAAHARGKGCARLLVERIIGTAEEVQPLVTKKEAQGGRARAVALYADLPGI
jgi:GNAT superfamily N-acetyltransferase